MKEPLFALALAVAPDLRGAAVDSTATGVVVLDQIPFSREGRIAVTLLAPAKDQATTQSDGTVKWILTLQPREKRLLPHRFAVEYPGDAPIVGQD
ncbi:MAG TPA: DUF4139 domain-containing protein [Opitutaceae bacterium]|nr:DUF4139 domain-containing protein [Opitutaceae bacterium]